MKEKNSSKKVLYITFIDFEAEKGTGSSVRPKRMYDAFVELGYEVKLLSGAMNNRKARQDGVKQIIDYLKDSRPDFCYIEPATGPMFFSCDRKLIKKIKQLDIPIAYFYRDIYWKFDVSKFNNSISLLSRLKAFVIKTMQKKEFELLKKCVSRFYFASNSVNKYMELEDFGILPPGCINLINEKIQHKDITAIYVGGATERYGMGLILESWKMIDNAKLIVVCPEKQWHDWCMYHPDYMSLPLNVKVYHLSDGEELNNLYRSADFSLIPILKSEYNDMAIPIKLFEYTSRDLPIVATNCYEMKKIIDKYNIGIVTADNEEEYIFGLKSMIEKLQQDKDSFRDNIKYMKKENMWTDRVKTIVHDMIG